MQNKSLLNKIAIVSGGTSEIGKAVSIRLARAGAIVIILGQDVEKGNDIISMITVEGCFAEFYCTDLMNKNEVEKSIKQVLEKYNKVDILVNNTDIIPSMNSKNSSMPETKNITNIILKIIFQLSKLILPKMIESKCGRIIHISSITPKITPLNSDVFNTSKIPINDIHAFTCTLSRKVKSYGIAVNTIAPVSITPTMSRLPGMKVSSISPQELLYKLQGETCINRFSGENGVAEMVMFLVSAVSKDITGKIFNISGDFFYTHFKSYLNKNEKNIPEIEAKTSKLFFNFLRVFHISRDILKKKIRSKTWRF